MAKCTPHWFWKRVFWLTSLMNRRLLILLFLPYFSQFINVCYIYLQLGNLWLLGCIFFCLLQNLISSFKIFLLYILCLCQVKTKSLLLGWLVVLLLHIAIQFHSKLLLFLILLLRRLLKLESILFIFILIWLFYFS